MAKADIDSVVEKAGKVYQHFNVTPPASNKLRAAMISRLSGFSPTKVDMSKIVRCDKTVGGIASQPLNYTVARQNQVGYDDYIENLNEDNKKKRKEDGGEFREKTTTSCRDHRRRKSTYRQIEEVNVGLNAGHQYKSDAEITALVEHICSTVVWPQLGNRTIDEAMALPNFSQYTGITKQNPLSLEAFNFLIRGVGKRKAAVTEVPPITRPDGSYINVPDAMAMGFFTFKVFESLSMFDCKRFEHKMQKRYEHLPYVTKILFKVAGAGADYADTFSNHCCVYFTGIFDLQERLNDGTVILGDYEKSKDYYSYLG